MSDKKQAPATSRNRDPILRVLKDHIPNGGAENDHGPERSGVNTRPEILEIASGSGEHCLYFADQLPGCSFTPSDIDDENLASIKAYMLDSRHGNIREPVYLDAARPEDWPPVRPDMIMCINMLHISLWQAAQGLFIGASEYLSAGGKLFLYGPFFEDDVKTAPTNASFHRSLRMRNKNWGLRNLKHVNRLADRSGFQMIKRVEMPANNLCLIYQI